MSTHFDPASLVLDTPVSEGTAQTLSHLAIICGAPSLNFSAFAVLRNATATIGVTTSMFPEVADFMAEFVRNLDSAMTELVLHETPDLSQISGFIANKQPALSLLTNLIRGANRKIEETIGNLLVVALLTSRPLPKIRSQRLLTLHSSHSDRRRQTSVAMAPRPS